MSRDRAARRSAAVPKGFARQFRYPAHRANHRCGLYRHHQHFLVGGCRQLLQGIDIIVGNEIIDGLNISLRDSLGDDLRGDERRGRAEDEAACQCSESHEQMPLS